MIPRFEREGPHYLESLGNDPIWNEERRIDIQIVRSLFIQAEQFPDRFTGEVLDKLIRGLPTFGGLPKKDLRSKDPK